MKAFFYIIKQYHRNSPGIPHRCCFITDNLHEFRYCLKRRFSFYKPILPYREPSCSDNFFIKLLNKHLLEKFLVEKSKDNGRYDPGSFTYLSGFSKRTNLPNFRLFVKKTLVFRKLNTYFLYYQFILSATRWTFNSV